MIDIAIKSVVLAVLGWVLANSLRRASASARYFVLTLTVITLAILPALLPLLPQWHAPFVRIEVPMGHAVAATAVVPQSEPIPWTILIWTAGCVIFSFRIVSMLLKLGYRRLKLQPIQDMRLIEVFEECQYGKGNRVFFALGRPGDPPMTWGFFHPTLLLPAEAVDWTVDRLRSVILHELAHIERADWLTNLIAEAVCAAYWPNPLVWLIAKAMARESERAADDRVLNRGLRATQYAGHLLEIVRETRGEAPKSALAMARPGGLDGRVRAILSDAACRRPIHGFAALGLVGGCAVVAAVVGAAAPTIVEKFESSPTHVINSQTEDRRATIASSEATTEPTMDVSVSPRTPETPVPGATSTGTVARPPRASAAKSAPPQTPLPPATHDVVLKPGFESMLASNDGDEADTPEPEDLDNSKDMADIDIDVNSDEIERQVNEGLKKGAEEYRKAMRKARVDIQASMKDMKANGVAAGITKAAVSSAMGAADQSLSVLFGQNGKEFKLSLGENEDKAPPGKGPH